MTIGVTCNGVTVSVGSTPSFDSSSRDDNDHINLRMDGDDPYIWLKEFPEECHATKDENEIEELDGAELEELQELEEVVKELEKGEDDTAADSGAILDKLRPCVGMEFNTAEEAYYFYNAYAGHVGFSVRKNHQCKSNNEVTSCRFVCNKEGLSKRQRAELKLSSSKDHKSPQREHGTTRTNCKASLSIKFVNGLFWQVSIFKEDHNHQLLSSPAKNRNMRSQKRFTLEELEIIRHMSAQNISTSKIYAYIAARRGGRRQLHFKRKDVSNQISTQNRRIIGMDVETTLAYFRKKQEEDPEFFYAIDADDEGLARHIFWVDGRARRAYLEFGDVVTFDTTYNTNRYSMPLAPFIGLNHHRSSIFFGMALIRSEREVNFIWLFQTWLSAMYGKHPISILTDQDRAMKAAINKIFPNTTHRCCQWHVMRKAREKFLPVYHAKPGLEDELKAVINRSLTVPDFEKAWDTMLDDYKIKNEGHWKVMYDYRDEWVPAFFRDKFFADMSTTQRSESMNAILKLWVNSHTSIYQFVQQIENMIEGIWNTESDEDIKNINEIPRPWSSYPIEHEARCVYTRKNYEIFKAILKETCAGVVIEHERDKRYEVSIKINHLVGIWRAESFIVDVDKATETFSCNCKGFEFEGFLCQHAIKVLHHVSKEQLPSKYILRRWCREANANAKRPIEERCKGSAPFEALQSFRRAKLALEYKKVEDLAVGIGDDFDMALARMMELQIDLTARNQNRAPMVASGEVEMLDPEVEETEKSATPATYLDPPVSQCKGRKKKACRFKSPIEEKAKKRRTCSYCHTQEGHNLRTCPKRLRDQHKGKKQVETIEDETEDETEDENEEEISGHESSGI